MGEVRAKHGSHCYFEKKSVFVQGQRKSGNRKHYMLLSNKLWFFKLAVAVER